jgi:hypothetical protein
MIEEALDALRGALAQGELTDERFDEAEVSRLTGTALLSRGSEKEAEAAFQPGARGGAVGFRRIVQGAGVRIVLTPVQAPNANAYAERFVRSIREECLDRLILVGRRRLLRALHEFVAPYHGERNHQGLGNELITPATRSLRATHVRCRQRLGGLLRYYHRAA